MKTLAAAGHFEAEIKRSRFIAHAARVDSLPETLSFFESVADLSASHNCWAWKLGHQYRFNDDGEPASSAGKPIWSAIDGKGLDNVMVVVTRHFGGTRLGIGGLIRAYGGSAARCIDQAGIVVIKPRVKCVIEAEFKWTGQLYAALDQCEATKLGEEYPPGGVLIRAELLESALPGLREHLRNATRGEAVVRISA